MLPSLHLMSISAKKPTRSAGTRNDPSKRGTAIDEMPSVETLRRVSEQIQKYLYPYLNKRRDTNNLWAGYWNFNPDDMSAWTTFDHINYIKSNEEMIVGAAEFVRMLGNKLKNKTATREEQLMALAWSHAANARPVGRARQAHLGVGQGVRLVQPRHTPGPVRVPNSNPRALRGLHGTSMEVPWHGE